MTTIALVDAVRQDAAALLTAYECGQWCRSRPNGSPPKASPWVSGLGRSSAPACAAKVAAAGLPLGMTDDPEPAAAAQKLMDACLEDEDEDKVREAIVGLRAVFYGPAPEPAAPSPPDESA